MIDKRSTGPAVSAGGVGDTWILRKNPSLKLTAFLAPRNGGNSNRNLQTSRAIFRGYVSFREGTS